MMLSLDFPLGRPTLSAALVRRQRALPAGVSPLVSTGDQVRAEQPIAEYQLPNQQRGVLIAGLGGRVVEALPGQFVFIEGLATVVHGIVGLGGPATGLLTMLPRGESLALVPIAPGSVILFPHQLPLTLLQRAATNGAAAIIAASASAREFEAFARADLTLLLDGLAPDVPRPPITVVLTEGFGTASMITTLYQMLSARLHSIVLLDGTTSPRQGVRPEILLAAPPGAVPQQVPADCTLAPGALVAVVAGQRKGARGQILNALSAQQSNEAGLRTPAVLVRFEDGSTGVLSVYELDRIG